MKKTSLLILASILTVIAALTVSSGQTAGNQSSPSKTWFVVVGVSKYQKLPGGQQLQFADRDAIAFADALKKTGASGDSVKLLVGADATTAAIKSAIGNWAARAASESDAFVIFFSGHGFYEREFKQSYLLAYDSDPNDPFATALSMNEIRQALGARVRSKRVLIIADAMRRDLFDPDRDAISAESFIASFKELSDSRAGVSAIIANSPGEFSREGQRWGGHGVFARHLLDAMSAASDSNGDGLIAADELFDIVAAKVAEDTSNKQRLWRAGVASQIAIAKVERPMPAVTAKVEPTATRESPVQTSQSKPEPELKAAQEQRTNQAVVPASDAPKPPAVSPPVATTKTTDQTESRKPSEPQPASVPADKKPTAAVEKKQEPAAKQESGASTAIATKATDSQSAAKKTSDSLSAAPKTTNAPKSNDTLKSTGVPKSTDSSSSAQKVNEPQPATSKTAQSQTRSAKPPAPVAAPPADALAINRANNLPGAVGVPATNEADKTSLPPPPAPRVALPKASPVNSAPETSRPASVNAEMPAAPAASSSTSILMELEAAIYANALLEPKNTSAWDLYQRAATDPAMAAGLSRLKPMLAESLVTLGRSIVAGDVRADNITDKVDDFKKAGQVFVRARALQPASADTAALEKLSAAQALIALQFYDEAERALSQLQGVKLAAIENSLGLVYQGKLDTFRAERAFKRAIELDPKWAAPHYNLALLYKSQQNPASLEEMERAAELDKLNAAVLAALGDEYFSRQQWERAAEAFRKAIAVKPADDTLHMRLGHALFSQGLQEEANRSYQKARELRGKP